MSGVVEVNFGNGEDLLVSYWGYLRGGGLIIDDPGIEVGDPIALHVTIKSSASMFRLKGHVVKRDLDATKSTVAFREGEAHDMLLSEALADGDEETAPRRYPRLPAAERAVTVLSGSFSGAAALVNVSEEGCCLLLCNEDRPELQLDDEAIVLCGAIEATGRVAWIRNTERGLLMSPEQALPLFALVKSLAPSGSHGP